MPLLLTDTICQISTRKAMPSTGGSTAPASVRRRWRKGMPAGLMDSFANEPGAQAHWKAFLARNRLKAPSIAEVVAVIREFVLTPLRLASARVRGST